MGFFLAREQQSLFTFFFTEWELQNRISNLSLHHSRSVLMEAQILSAGPSLMFMVEMRWSSRSSSRAWPSISWERNWAASSSQPEQKQKQTKNLYICMCVCVGWSQRFAEGERKKTLNEDTPTLKRGDEAAHFLHAPLSRSGWEEVGPLSLEAPGSQAIGSSGAVADLGARVRRGRRQRGRIVLVLVPIAGHVLWAAGLGVTLQFTASFTSVINLLFCTRGLLRQVSCHATVTTPFIGLIV